MRRHLTQRELRNDSGQIMRELETGRTFIVTRNGVPIGELSPLRRRLFVTAESMLESFAGAPRLDRARFRTDVDDVINQDPTPRG